MTIYFRVLCLLCCSLLVSMVQAQSDEKWYFAQNPTSGQVVAYTADGETHVLLEAAEPRTRAWRLDERSALAALEDGSVYYLTPDEATALTATFDTSESSGGGRSLRGYSEPYAVLVQAGLERIPNGAGLLVNTDAGTLDLMANILFSGYMESVFFSTDGQYVRYVRDESPDDDRWTLVERKLATGEERAIFTLDEEGFPGIKSDGDGANWLYSRRNPENKTSEYVLIANDGSTEVVGATSADHPVAFHLFDNRLFSYPFGCEGDCVAELRSLDSETHQSFPLPAVEGALFPLIQPDDTHLLVFDIPAGQYWLLSEDEAATSLGYRTSQNILTPVSETFSPDGRWLLVLDSDSDPAQYAVIDLSTGERVHEGARGDSSLFVQITYSDGGWVAIDWTGERAMLYRAVDETTVELPNAGLGSYFDVLADGTVLYFGKTEDNDDQTPGIYHYDPTEDVYTLLVEDAAPLGR